MSKRAFKMLRQRCRMEVNRKPVDAYAWPGGYQLFYICEDTAVLCPACVNKEIARIHDARPKKDIRGRLQRSDDPQWNVIGVQPNYEDDSLYCEHCNELIPSAYGEPEPATIEKVSG